MVKRFDPRPEDIPVKLDGKSYGCCAGGFRAVVDDGGTSFTVSGSGDLDDWDHFESNHLSELQTDMS